ncbi:YheT family hydrolase [Dyadobacter psychrotolerans]|uniref:Alpha/beta fold hydrolase n=1 Tax=Dyadobacter psychrotolerans TaxID=2541721 RepID=A0A4R5DQT3_9BACT|nr:alpha/beta fold hydrolase [Dyadobacter psychrotolerans]TDE16766.1 alpha/beta fold hydrolase [Dyadobacter psychrotolerans]
MTVLKKTDLVPPFWLPGGHLQTIYPALLRKITDVNYIRERILTPDDDFLDLDWSFSKTKSGKLVILSHGLEGDSNRQYVLGMVRLLNKNGYDCLAWNFRSCGGEMNQTSRFYHSGATDDLDHVVSYAAGRGYQEINLIGFSLGGNLTLKYLGETERHLNPLIKKGIVFSVPMDLKACSLAIIKRENRVYMQRFMNTLLPKVSQKAKLFPDHINMEKGSLVKTLYDFDDIYTAPLHGFDSADHYYESCSSMFFVQNISIPTLIVNAMNDPIVPVRSLPLDLVISLSNVQLELSRYGGHCGFRPSRVFNAVYWSEKRALNFLQSENL